MNNNKSDKLIFSVTVEEFQMEAERLIGRNLTDEELRIATKCIESGLSFGLDTVVKAAIEEAVEVVTTKKELQKGRKVTNSQ